MCHNIIPIINCTNILGRETGTWKLRSICYSTFYDQCRWLPSLWLQRICGHSSGERYSKCWDYHQSTPRRNLRFSRKVLDQSVRHFNGENDHGHDQGIDPRAKGCSGLLRYCDQLSWPSKFLHPRVQLRRSEGSWGDSQDHFTVLGADGRLRMRSEVDLAGQQARHLIFDHLPWWINKARVCSDWQFKARHL